MATSNLHRYTAQEALNIITAGGGYDYVTNATVNAHTYVAITASNHLWELVCCYGS